MHETGIFGKQSSCIFMSLTANLTLLDNVCFNGPRAGFNWNDGFGGGTVMRGNLIFNTVRETGDHGPVRAAICVGVAPPNGRATARLRRTPGFARPSLPCRRSIRGTASRTGRTAA